MVYITEELIRRRAEHNDCEILSLEEVSLHQQDIERIEHVDRWCRELRILYLQNNLIPRIENVGRLKKLEYLNLALNNIQVIENLEGCESLRKLDLTVNFVGLLSSVESLQHNAHLRELFLVGNPCTEFQGYRQYVVAALPQLKWLDGTEISRSERIRASQGLEQVRRRVREQEQEYLRRREEQREEASRRDKERKPDSQDDKENLRSAEEEEQDFWHTPCSFTPESRLEAHRRLEEEKNANRKEPEKKNKPPRTLITADGRVMNINEPKLAFSLTEDEENDAVVLDLAVYRHMDTSLMDVDVQPTYARVSVKGKMFQVVLPAEVKPDSSTARRSQTTGHLVLTMPRAEGELRGQKPVPRRRRDAPSRSSAEDRNRKDKIPERLEVDPSKRKSVDITNIVSERSSGEDLQEKRDLTAELPEGFMDDPEVPPLI
ncbi:dynein axonemal assembly factor 11 isoform X2 [Poecilia latipinna]|uniref:dynein axonemal assembly factor 11 isoform X2 n=1 Tax=Poecilia latipinna TaxID=48699 RepID=UPI00072E94EB|nr:PREDICTED: protein tilB homolog isoform X2 [Poecilia latipinna]